MYKLKRSVRRKYRIKRSKKKSRSRSKRRYRRTHKRSKSKSRRRRKKRNIFYDGVRLETITPERLKEIRDVLHYIMSVLFSNALMVKFRHDRMWDTVDSAIGKVSVKLGQLYYIYNTNFEKERQMLEDKPRYVDRTLYTRIFYYTPEIEEIILNPKKYNSILKKLSDSIYPLLEKVIETVESFLMYIDETEPEVLYKKNKGFLQRNMAPIFRRKSIDDIVKEFEEQKDRLRKYLSLLYEF